MFITALDLGSAQIKTLIAELGDDDKLSLIEVLKTPASGIRRGEIADVGELVKILSLLFEDIKGIHKDVLKNIYVNANGKNISTQISRGITAISRGTDNEIYQEDIDKVKKSAEVINFRDSNRVILHSTPQEYIVNGVDQIKNPLGMKGNRLEVNCVIVDAFGPPIDEISDCVEEAGGASSGLVFGIIAAAKAALSKTHRDLGAVLIDIGAETTGMAVYEEGKLVLAKVFPVGAAHITNDLAIFLKSSITTAERVKLSHGFALAKEAPIKEKINLNDFDPTLKGTIGKKAVAEVIEARMAEIFELVRQELKTAGKTRLPAGAVLCGGGAKQPGAVDLAKEELDLPVQLASLDIDFLRAASSDLKERAEEIDFAAALGLLIEGREQALGEGKITARKGLEWVSKILRSFKT